MQDPLPTRVGPGDTVAAVDIGTNSFHLVVARVLPNRRFQLLTTEKEMVRLGHGSGDMKRLEDDAIDRGIACLQRFRRFAEVYDAPLHAVATSAVREAENRNDFLERCRSEAGVEVEVISGVEEARLIHLGVLQAVPVFDRQLLVFDIGGGSTEFVVGRGGETSFARSLKVGAIRLTERFFPAGVVEPAAVAEMRRYLQSFLAPTAVEIVALGHEVAVASSGTAENVVRVAANLSTGTSPHSLNGYTATKQDIDAAVEVLLAAPTPVERALIAGVETRRADIVAAGAVLLQTICDLTNISELTISDYALREGVLFDRLRPGASENGLHHLSDLRRTSVDHLLDQFEPDRGHAMWTTEVALQIFDQTRALHRLPLTCIDYLEAGGLLANIGRSVAHASHHLHSYYLIRNSEHLMGFTSHEIELIAQVARYHRKSSPKSSHGDFAALPPQDQRMVELLAGMLRIGIGLDRGHAWRVQGVRCRTSEPMGTLHIGAIVDSHVDAELEVYSANERSSLLATALGRDVIVEVV